MSGRDMSDEERAHLRAVPGRAESYADMAAPIPTRADLREAMALCPSSDEWSEAAREEALGLVFMARSAPKQGDDR